MSSLLPVRCERTCRAQLSPQGRIWRRWGLAVAVLLGSLVAGSGVAAHSGLGAASPAPGSIVGGEITEIQLRYSSTVEDVEGSVTAPDGTVLESEFVQETDLAVRIQLTAPLDQPGEYAVRHTSTDVEDMDRIASAFLFTYDPTAPPPQLEILEVDDGGRSPWLWVVLGFGLVVVAVLAWRLITATKRARSGSGSPENA